jgi:MFS family permease
VKLRLWSIVAFVLLFWLSLSQVVVAQSPSQPTYEQALRWVVGPGAAVLAGLAISVLSEYWSKFQSLEAKYKVAVYFGLCLVATFTATALAVASGLWGAWNDIQNTWWPALWNGIAASGIGTLFHAWVPSPLRKTPEDGG